MQLIGWFGGCSMVKARVLLLLVPLLVLVASAGCTAAPATLDTERALSAFIQYTDLRIDSVRDSIEILAATREAKSGNWDTMKGLLAGYQRSAEGLIVWYVRPDGTYYTVDRGLMDVSLTDRSYFAPLIGRRQTIIGELVVSKSTGQRSAVVAVPVIDGDTLVGAIGTSIFLEKLADQIDTMLNLGSVGSFFALAPNYLTVLHNKKEREFLDPRELGSETLKVATEKMIAETAGTTTYEYDNQLKKVRYRASELTNWRFAIAVPVR